MLPEDLTRAGHLSQRQRAAVILIALVCLAATTGLCAGVFVATGSWEVTTMIAGLGLLFSLTVPGIYREVVLGRQAKRLAAVAARDWPRARVCRILSDRIPWRLRDALERLLM